MTTAPDLDPYLLPMPTPASPVVLPHLACAVHAHLNGRYCNPVWPLAPLTENPSARRPKIHWENWPSCFRDEMRLAAWNLVNGQLRPTFLLGRSSRMRGRLSAPEVHAVTERWKSLAAWLEERGIRRLADCTADVLHDYGQRARDAGHSRSHVMKTLAALGYGRLTSSAPSLRASGDRLGRNWASTATCPPQTAAAGRTRPSPWQSRPWDRSSSGRCGWSRTCRGTSSPPGPNGSASSRLPAPPPGRQQGTPPWRHTSGP